MSIRWLHISDLHFKAEVSYDRDTVLSAFLSSIPALIGRYGAPHIVFLTGDIAHSGRSDEYEQASFFLDRLLEELSLPREMLFVVPGNHDVDRRKGRGLARTLLSADESDNYFDPSEPLLHVAQRQHGFLEWHRKFLSREFPSSSTLCKIACVVEGQALELTLVNTAAFCFDDEDSGKLWVGRRCVDSTLSDAAARPSHLKLALMHHPFPWISQEEVQNVKASIYQHSDVVLSGHLHVTDLEALVGVTGQTLHLSAGAMYQTRKWPNKVLWCEVEGSELLVTPLRYEDSPQAIWTIDPSIFPEDESYRRKLSLLKVGPKGTGRADIKRETAVASDSPSDTARKALEDSLFVAPSGALLYVPPRLMRRPPELMAPEDVTAAKVTVNEVVLSAKCYYIEGRSEYGGSVLCKTIHSECLKVGQTTYLRSASALPKYSKKLQSEFDDRDLQSMYTLILDDFDIDRDERLLKELHGTGWFARIIAVQTHRGVKSLSPRAMISPMDQYEHLYLWPLSRSDVRDLAERMLSTSDGALLSAAVDKAYRDLLGLRIPLTPANVLMYLRILEKEENFAPLNRVDIIGKYLSDALSKPSDIYADAFSSRIKLDVLSTFANTMLHEKRSGFDDRYWMEFCASYAAERMVEFDARELLLECESTRIFLRSAGTLFYRYSFFFSYLVGRYLAAHRGELAKFLEGELYLHVGTMPVIEVVTGLGADNAFVLEFLTMRLNYLITAFSENYIPEDFDPLRVAKWVDSDKEHSEMWPNVLKQIAEGPKSAREIDIVRQSLSSEVRTEDQRVSYERFAESERALFLTEVILRDALRNADDVPGAKKVDALEALLQAERITFQVGCVFADILSKTSRFTWGGVAFNDFDRAASEAPTLDPVAAVIIGLAASISSQIGSELGSSRLAGVFAARDLQSGSTGFEDLVNFRCIINARGKGWFDAANAVIIRFDKNAYYLHRIFSALMILLKEEVMSGKDRDLAGQLVAAIQAKRAFGKQNPGAKAIGKVLDRLVRGGHLPSKD